MKNATQAQFLLRSGLKAKTTTTNLPTDPKAHLVKPTGTLMIMKIAEVKRDLSKGKNKHKVGVDLHRLPQKGIKLEVGQEANVQKAAQCLRPRSPSKAAAARREEERRETKQHVLARPRTSAKAAAARNRCRRAKQLLPSLKLRGRVKGVRNVAGEANLRIPQEPRPLQMIPRTAHPPLQKTREWIS